MTLFSGNVNLTGAMANHLLATGNRWGMGNDGFRACVIDGQHGHATFELLCKAGEHPMAAGHPGFDIIVRPDGAYFKQAGANKISNF